MFDHKSSLRVEELLVEKFSRGKKSLNGKEKKSYTKIKCLTVKEKENVSRRKKISRNKTRK